MLGALCPLDVLDIFVRSSYVNYYTYCISVYTRNGRTTAIRPKMLQRSGKASRSATVRIAQQTTPTSLSCLDQVVSKSAKQRNHISRRPQSLRSVTSEDGASTQPPALEAALTRDGRQMVRSSGTNTTSTTSTRTRGYCCGPLRSFNRPPAADFLPGDSYTFENSNPLYRPVSRVARSWKSSSASLVDEDAGVESAADNTERRGELKSFLLTGEAAAVALRTAQIGISTASSVLHILVLLLSYYSIPVPSTCALIVLTFRATVLYRVSTLCNG